MGLGTMRYRARLLGTTCEIISQPAGGTIVRCALPLHHAPENS
jgi:signal transduction histidine kinase